MTSNTDDAARGEQVVLKTITDAAHTRGGS